MSSADKERLLQLLDYVQHIVRLPERARFSVKDSGSFVYLQEDLHDRIGVQFNGRDDQGPVWLKLVRLQRIDPPEPPEELRPWISMIKNPLREPKVAADRIETVTREESEMLVERRLVDLEDVKKLRKRGPNKEKMAEVTRRLQKDGTLSEAIGKYMAGPWRRWAELERPRRTSMKVYDDFFKLHQSIQAGAVEAPVEVIWGIGVAVWKTGKGTIKHPLIEVLVEIDVDPKTNDILVRRRDAEPQLFIKQFQNLDSPGIVKLQEETRKYFEKFRKGHDPRDFSPFAVDTFEPLLRLATTLLSSSAQYYPDIADDPKDPRLPAPTEALQITDTWAIYARPRSDNLFYEDIERLKEIVEVNDFDSLQTAACEFVADPSDKPTYQPRGVDLLGGPLEKSDDLEAGEQSTKDFELFFPREYNDAQVKIIHELERSDGVIVQGPPGTGKTHTIANIICHYLATGRRVLVTSQGEPALKVLREFIPEEIRRLTIALLTKDREGLQQLETAVTLLANEVSRIDPRQIEKQIIESEQGLRDLRAQIKENERQVREIAERQLTPQQHELFGKGGCSPAELATRLAKDVDRHSWLPDDPGLEPESAPQFTNKDVAAAAQARRRLGADLQYLTNVLPEVKNLPDNSKLQEFHEQIIDADQNDPHAEDSDFPKLSVLAENAIERATALIDDLRALIEVQDLVAPYTWLAPLFQAWLEFGFGQPTTKPFDDLVPDLEDLAVRISEFEARPVSLPVLGDDANEVADAVARAAKGRRPFGTLAIGSSRPKLLFAEILVDGEPPANKEGWRHAEDFFKLRADACAVAVCWNDIAEQFGLPVVDESSEAAAASLVEHLDPIVQARQATESDIRQLRDEIPELFPHGIDALEVYRDRDAALLAIEAVEVNLTRSDRATAQEAISAVAALLEAGEGPIVQQAVAFLRGKVGNQLVRTSEISSQWDALLADLKRVHSYSRDFEMVRKLADLVEQSGAPKWAEALRTEPVTGDEDPWTPKHALDSWKWKRLATYLRSIDGREPIRRLSRAYLALETERKATLTEVVRLRTFLGLYVNMTDLAKSALVRFTAAIRHIGSGEGSRSRRHKRDARDAMNDCYGAVPCWIMPIWRVSETLPPEIGSFDLVIVDEASQSDILAMPTLMRGKKLLIVGDDKQVSPVAPFVEERKLLQLRNQHLSNQIFVDLMIPGSSLYDLANAVFSGRRVMLDEHFRCVEPIIRFSFRFYPEKIIPVRIPKASERLEPPMVDVYVAGGKRDKKKVNQVEATAIVDEIERLVNDPVFRKRSIGVVSLIGAQQGVFIQNLLLRRIGQERYLRHQIDCGDSATFQGRERDIMFVSMVAAPGRIAGQTAVIYEQRFNVAMSRARDRMYLFRSVQPHDLNPNDLKAKVIEHFTRAPEGDRGPVEDLVELCDTDLERQVYEHLAELGYRVTPRVTVGEHSIDLVVEGADDRRLAIGIDGDRDQTADEWLHEWSQEKVLERVGWRFWRCWASSFALDSEACIKDLLDTLAEMEIEPIGQASVQRGQHSEQRVVKEAKQTNGGDQDHDEDPEARKAKEDVTLMLEDEERDESEPVVEVGDRILVSYSDDPSRYRILVISESEHDPENGVLISSDPVGQAILGAAVGEEIETRLDDATGRVLTIFEIEKTGSDAALTQAEPQPPAPAGS